MPEDANWTPRLAALVSLSLASVAIAAQRLLHQSTIAFQSIDIAGSSQQEIDEQLGEQTHQFQIYLATLKRRAHIETIALTLFVLVLFFILYTLCKRSGVSNWTRYVIVTAVAASVAGFLLEW